MNYPVLTYVYPVLPFCFILALFGLILIGWLVSLAIKKRKSKREENEEADLVSEDGEEKLS
ncbi:hypothetical protein DRQ19_00835 [bacterium]|nr:MAG: hypothetical protein DRQ19_00835 [bacterium]